MIRVCIIGHLHHFTIAKLNLDIVLFGNKPNTAELYRAVITAEAVKTKPNILNLQGCIRKLCCIFRCIDSQTDISLKALRKGNRIVAVG